MTRRSSRAFVPALILLLVALVLAPAATAASPTPVFAGEWGWGVEGGDPGLISPGAIATDAAGRVYVADTNHHRIQKFTSNGKHILTWGWGVLDGSAEFQLCTADCGEGISGSGDGQFYWPNGIAVSPTGAVYVADTFNDRIQQFDSGGHFVRTWGSAGTGTNNFESPFSITTDASGYVYVSDTGNHRIRKFDPEGGSQGGWGSHGTADGLFSNPWGIASWDGNVYVADQVNHRVQVFDSTGGFLGKWGSEGTGDGQFKWPSGVAADAAGNIYVIDQGNNRIEKFDSDGLFLTQWGSEGSGPGQFAGPYDLATDAFGNIFVADRENNRVQKFSPPSTSLAIKAPRTVAAGSRARITGSLKSADAGCVASQKVKLKKGAATVATKTTSATGTYKFRVKIKRKTAVQVLYPGSPECGASKSSKKTIRVS